MREERSTERQQMEMSDWTPTLNTEHLRKYELLAHHAVCSSDPSQFSSRKLLDLEIEVVAPGDDPISLHVRDTGREFHSAVAQGLRTQAGAAIRYFRGLVKPAGEGVGAVIRVC